MNKRMTRIDVSIHYSDGSNNGGEFRVSDRGPTPTQKELLESYRKMTHALLFGDEGKE